MTTSPTTWPPARRRLPDQVVCGGCGGPLIEIDPAPVVGRRMALLIPRVWVHARPWQWAELPHQADPSYEVRGGELRRRAA